MQLRWTRAVIPPPQPLQPCAQCGQTIFAPEWSELFDERRIRHLWTCSACGYRFESLVCYPSPVDRPADATAG